MRKVNVAIVGATGMVGDKIREVLAERVHNIDTLYLFASKRSAGKKIEFQGREFIVEELTQDSFKDKHIDYALFSAGGGISDTYGKIAVKEGITVIDNSSFYRMEDDIPLVVPEVNPHHLRKDSHLVANPNCSTIQAMLPLKVIDDLFGLKRVVYTTFQAVSGAGVGGVNDLVNKEVKQFTKSIHNNVLPQIDVFTESGYTKEELKMIDETRKILGHSDLKVTATTVRVPILNTHAMSVNIECERPVNLEVLNAAFDNADGIILVHAPNYPVAQEVDGSDDVYVGRVRLDESVENGLNIWIVADNIRKGAATNTVQIMETLMAMRNN